MACCNGQALYRHIDRVAEANVMCSGIDGADILAADRQQYDNWGSISVTHSLARERPDYDAHPRK